MNNSLTKQVHFLLIDSTNVFFSSTKGYLKISIFYFIYLNSSKYVKIRNSFFIPLYLYFTKLFNSLCHKMKIILYVVIWFEWMDECVNMISVCIVYNRGFLLPALSYCIFHNLMYVKSF